MYVLGIKSDNKPVELACPQSSDKEWLQAIAERLRQEWAEAGEYKEFAVYELVEVKPKGAPNVGR